MFLDDLASIIFTKGTLSENTHITVKTCAGNNRIIWEGRAKQLKYFAKDTNWIVEEVLNDTKDGKVITVK